MDPVRLTAAASTLQRMADDPEALERSRRRFDFDEPPPPYSSGTTTEPPTPTLRPQLCDQDAEELRRQPLSYEELYWFRKNLRGFHAGGRFQSESNRGREHILTAWVKRDQSFRRLPLYRGPDLVGRAGQQRQAVMIRHSIKKRWERLGVWNPKWGIPGRPNRGPDDDTDVQMTSWAPRDEERPDERAIRQHLESKGEWTATCSEPGHAADVDVDANSRESLITSRPWYVWKLDVEEEAIRLARPLRTHWLGYETAAANVTARWKARGDWKESWVAYDDVYNRSLDRPGWKWRHESPSPEPTDPSDMDFSPSEVDALESVPPPTPTPPPPFELYKEPFTGVSLFGNLLGRRNETAPFASAPLNGEEENNSTEYLAAVDALESVPFPTPTPPPPFELYKEPFTGESLLFGNLLGRRNETEPSASAPLNGEEENNSTEYLAAVLIPPCSARSRQCGAPSISARAAHRTEPSTLWRTRQAKAVSKTGMQPKRILKPAIGHRRSARLAEKARLKELDMVPLMDASKGSDTLNMEVAKEPPPWKDRRATDIQVAGSVNGDVASYSPSHQRNRPAPRSTARQPPQPNRRSSRKGANIQSTARTSLGPVHSSKVFKKTTKKRSGPNTAKTRRR
ncbi:MAG: hypothetical protein Q9211_003977 [Gyalolechia sp. 1 TL-2023]